MSECFVLGSVLKALCGLFFFFVIFQYFSRGNAAAFSHAEGDQGLESSSLSMVTIWSILSDPEADLTSSSLLLSESVRELD